MLAGTAAVVQIDTDGSPGVAQRFGVRGIPALFLLVGGKVVDQMTGAQSAEAVVAWFRRHRI